MSIRSAISQPKLLFFFQQLGVVCTIMMRGRILQLLRTTISQRWSRVANESILRLVDYRIIFRTIFFTWLPECIKKIACLLCGSVLAWRSSSQDLLDYTIEILRKTRVAINVFNAKLGDTRSILIVVSVLEGKNGAPAPAKKMFFCLVST